MTPRLSSAWAHARNCNLTSSFNPTSQPSRLKFAAAAAAVATIAGVAASAASPAVASTASSLPEASTASSTLPGANTDSNLPAAVLAAGSASPRLGATAAPAGSTATAVAAAPVHGAAAPATPASAHAATATAAAAQKAPAKPAHAAAPAGHAAPAHQGTKVQVAARQHPIKHVAGIRHHAIRPWLIFDSVTPSAIPRHHEVATYATGGFAVSPSQVAGRHVLWIDTRGTDPGAGALDVEPGDATPAVAASWVWHKLHAAANEIAVIYTMRSEWPAVKAAVHRLPRQMQSHVRWWIADPTGYAHLVPGSNATQWYWGKHYDISTATSGF